jgi:hypothetical protein
LLNKSFCGVLEAGGRRRDYDDLKEGEVQGFRDITFPFLALYLSRKHPKSLIYQRFRVIQ